MILYTLSNCAAPLITLFVWLSFTPVGQTSVFSRNNLIWYFILAMFVKLVTSSWFGVFLASRIRRGAISPFLLQPVDYIVHILSNNIAEKIIKLIILLPILITLVVLFKIPFLIVTAIQSFAALFSLVMAAVIYFLIDINIGLLAFWLDETSAIDDFYGLLLNFFSGMLIPLVALPIVLRNISYYLPFRFTLSLPIEILLGQLTNNQILQSLLLQFFWLIVVWFIYRLLWSKGLKSYSASGA